MGLGRKNNKGFTMKLILIGILLGLGVFGVVHREEIKIYTELSQMKKQFDSEAKEFGLVTKPVKFVVLKGTELPSLSPTIPKPVAFCLFGRGLVFVRDDFWTTRSTNEKTVLLYHELGHCGLSTPKNLVVSGLDHFEDFVDIMQPTTFNTDDENLAIFKFKLFSRVQMQQFNFYSKERL